MQTSPNELEGNIVLIDFVPYRLKHPKILDAHPGVNMYPRRLKLEFELENIEAEQDKKILGENDTRKAN